MARRGLFFCNFIRNAADITPEVGSVLNMYFKALHYNERSVQVKDTIISKQTNKKQPLPPSQKNKSKHTLRVREGGREREGAKTLKWPKQTPDQLSDIKKHKTQLKWMVVCEKQLYNV